MAVLSPEERRLIAALRKITGRSASPKAIAGCSMRLICNPA
jgi:hypothetical protein